LWSTRLGGFDAGEEDAVRCGRGGRRTGKEGRAKSRTKLETDEGKHWNNTFISPATPDWLVPVAALLSHLSHGHQAMSAQNKYFINQFVGRYWTCLQRLRTCRTLESTITGVQVQRAERAERRKYRRTSEQNLCAAEEREGFSLEETQTCHDAQQNEVRQIRPRTRSSPLAIATSAERTSPVDCGSLTAVPDLLL
jgi:hypothetical protein